MSRTLTPITPPVSAGDAVLAVLPKYTFFETVQTASEHALGTNTEADLLYDDFVEYYTDAVDKLADILASAGDLVLSAQKEKKALCYLITMSVLERQPSGQHPLYLSQAAVQSRAALTQGATGQ